MSRATAENAPEFLASFGSEENFRSIFDATPACVKLVAPDGLLLHMNSTGLSIIGVERLETVTGKCIYDLVVPGDREKYRQFNQRICSGETGTLQFDIVGMDGVLHHMESHGTPFRHSNGTNVQLGITRDISERRKSDRASLLLSSIVDSSDDAIISKDLSGIITSWNNSAVRMFGYTPEEAIGQPVAALLIPEDRQEEEVDILARIGRGDRVDHFETIRRARDGRLLELSLTISPVKNAEGTVIGASKIARDISQKRIHERAIEELNQRLERDLSAMTRLQELSTLLVRDGDIRQLLSEVIAIAVDITGADMGHIQLTENGSLRIVAQKGFSPGYLDYFAIRRGAPAGGEILRSGRRILIADVTQSPLYGEKARKLLHQERVVLVQATPLTTRSGELLGILSTHYRTQREIPDRELRLLDLLARQAADFIERQQVESALRASEGRFRQLADSMPQIVWTARPDGQVDYFNERWYEFTGIARDETSDDTWIAVMHPDDLPQCLTVWNESLRSGKPYQTEYRLWDLANKRWRWFMGRALPVREESGAITKWFGSCTDIHARKEVEDELRRANVDLEQFAFSATHDLQEPLRGARIYSELLMNRYASRLDGEALEFLGYLHSSAERMQRLVDDLLAYTRTGTPDGPLESIDANAALASALSNLNEAISETAADIRYESLPSVRMHGVHLQQLFQNLIGNAIKYRNQERTPLIEVTAERENGDWIFSVTDNGIGIEAEYTEGIFGLFKRLHNSNQYSGTGIGLAICHRIVDRYKGRIWVESTPGKGSAFRFALPV